MLGADGISPATTLSPALAAKPGASVKGAGGVEKVKEMATEMEATFLSMLLKEMRQTLDPDGGLFPGDSGDVHGGLFDLYLGRHLADTGGIGVAAALLRQTQVTGTGPAPKTAPTTDAPAPTDPRGHTPPAPRA